MEAALRTVYEVVTGEEPPSLDFEGLRGHAGIKEAEVDLNGTKVKVAITNGLGNARVILDKIRSGEADYQFVEVMCCPGGCVGGGGQPFTTDRTKRLDRADGLYKDDAQLPLRQSHKNPEIIEIYESFLEKPNSHKAHDLLHTHYKGRKTKA